ncbi:DUF6479 family protein [Streptomyces sp. NPDC014889]|uniref:DUF6479 family protein n=1 Tax=Streptomyces sp. NPDC014889 TaxID=3364928 RepID=UPI0036F7CD87
MDTASFFAADTGTHPWVIYGAFVPGIVIAAALVWAVVIGIRVMRRESERPTEREQPHLPVTGAVHEISEMRELDELHPDGGERLMPYELHATGTRRSQDQHRRRWHPGSSGSFGGGGPGRT